MEMEVPPAKQLNWLKINPRHDQLHDARLLGKYWLLCQHLVIVIVTVAVLF